MLEFMLESKAKNRLSISLFCARISFVGSSARLFAKRNLPQLELSGRRKLAMDFVVAFLMLFVPGLIALCIHEKTLVRFNRENWQPLLWKYLFYSFAIVFTAYFVMYLDYPGRRLSFSSQAEAHSNVLMVSFVVKYSLLAVASALVLPIVCKGLCSKSKPLLDFIEKRKSYKIPEDE
jgi:hypothetical protein